MDRVRRKAIAIPASAAVAQITPSAGPEIQVATSSTFQAASGTLTPGPEIQVNTITAGCQQLPAVAADASGKLAVVWQSDQDPGGEGWDAAAQAFDSNGNKVGGELLVNTTTAGAQTAPRAAYLAAPTAQAVQCTGSCATAPTSATVDLSLPKIRSVFCVLPPVNSCNETCSGASGAAGPSCDYCRRTGGDAGCGLSLDGAIACSLFGSGPGAFLRYTAGGPGTSGLPGSSGTAPWQATLGIAWSHDHAARIVIDNTTEGINHVWLITKDASFREFSNPTTGTGLRLYQSHAPSDEFRQLSYDSASGGWQLKGLDGAIESFRTDGQWWKTVLPADAAHPTLGTYNAAGQLTRVDFPDGRSETYTYTGTKLGTITENTVSGTAARTWTYLWTGDHLTGIQRPDGTAWELTYGLNGAKADALSRIRLIGTDGTSGRVMAAFDYDANGHILHSWRGDPSFAGPAAVDKQTFTYTGTPVAQTVVNQTVSDAFTQTTTGQLTAQTDARNVATSRPSATTPPAAWHSRLCSRRCYGNCRWS